MEQISIRCRCGHLVVLDIEIPSHDSEAWGGICKNCGEGWMLENMNEIGRSELEYLKEEMEEDEHK